MGDAPAWVALNRLDDLPDMVDLAIDGNTASDELLTGLGNLKRLKHLRINSDSMDGSFLESLRDVTNLTSLDLSSVALRDQAVIQIGRFDALETVRLLRIRIKNPESMRDLSKLRNLKEIHLSGSFPNEGLQALAGLEALEYVSVACESLSNDGVSRLAGSSSVFALEIFGPNIDDDAIDSLAAMRGLNMLTLHYTKVTQAGVEKLKRLRPDIDVQADYPPDGGSIPPRSDLKELALTPTLPCSPSSIWPADARSAAAAAAAARPRRSG